MPVNGQSLALATQSAFRLRSTADKFVAAVCAHIEGLTAVTDGTRHRCGKLAQRNNAPALPSLSVPPSPWARSPGTTRAPDSKSTGLRLTKQRLSRLANNLSIGWLKSADMVQALAVALDVPERIVVLACAAPFRIDVRKTSRLFEVRLPTIVSTLETTMHDAILHGICAITEGASTHEYDTECHEQEPRTRAGGAQLTQSPSMPRAGGGARHRTMT